MKTMTNVMCLSSVSSDRWIYCQMNTDFTFECVVMCSDFPLLTTPSAENDS